MNGSNRASRRRGAAALGAVVAVAVAAGAPVPAEARFFFGIGVGAFPGFYWPFPYYPYPAPYYYPYYAAPSYYPSYAAPYDYPPPSSYPRAAYPQPGAAGAPSAITYTSRPAFTNAAGETCREYKAMRNLGNRPREVYGTACRDRSGQWRIVN